MQHATELHQIHHERAVLHLNNIKTSISDKRYTFTYQIFDNSIVLSNYSKVQRTVATSILNINVSTTFQLYHDEHRIEAHFVTRSWTISKWPCHAALWIAVLPSSLFTQGSTLPDCMSAFALLKSPRATYSNNWRIIFATAQQQSICCRRYCHTVCHVADINKYVTKLWRSSCHNAMQSDS